MAMRGRFQRAEIIRWNQPKVDGGNGRSVHPERSPREPQQAQTQMKNRQTNMGIKSNKQRLVHDGRANQAAGRGGS